MRTSGVSLLRLGGLAFGIQSLVDQLPSLESALWRLQDFLSSMPQLVSFQSVPAEQRNLLVAETAAAQHERHLKAARVQHSGNQLQFRVEVLHGYVARPRFQS